MIIAIHQPDYLPYPGYFYKIANCDCFVFHDDTQYSNGGISNWNRIKTPQGELHLKVPVKETMGDTIQEVTSRDNLGWKQKHLRAIKMNYTRAKFYEQIYSDIESLLIPEYKNIAEMNIAIIQHISNKFGISKCFECSSTLGLNTRKEERVIDICKAFGGNTYLSGNGAKVYQVEEHFRERGVELQYTKYHPITYHQLWGGFLPNMSIIDYLFNHGYNWELIETQMAGE